MTKFGEFNILEVVSDRLSDKYGKSVDVLSSSSISGGCINNAIKLETNIGNFFLKWNSNCPSDLFLREAESLKELSKIENPYITIPEVIDVKESDEIPGYLVLSFLEPSPAFGENIDEDLGKGLALIHKYSNDKFGFQNDNYCGATVQDNSWKSSWIDFFTNNRLRHIVGLCSKLRNVSNDEQEKYEKFFQKLPELITEDSKPALIHGDLWSGNYMNTSTKPALIDPAAYYADREMEMGIMTMFGGFSNRFWEAYNEVYPLPNDWQERNKIYQLYHVLNHYYLFGGGYGHQGLQIVKYYIG